jgi:hypothetical protein
MGETVGRFAKSLLGPKSVVEYLGRYTHKIAISNHRIQACKWPTFWVQRLSSKRAKEKYEFNPANSYGGFVLHILPKRFVKISYSFWAVLGNVKAKALQQN